VELLRFLERATDHRVHDLKPGLPTPEEHEEPWPAADRVSADALTDEPGIAGATTNGHVHTG